jgi:ABC-2 type transport system ATP-binding protein
MSILKVENLSFLYPETHALKDLNFSIEAGRIIALVGPNGAGKSTLFKCLIAELEPFTGTISFNGTDYSKKPHELAKHIGYLSDFFGLYTELTVRQSLNYFCEAREIEKAKTSSRVVEIATLLGIDDKLDAPVNALSRGMKQRLAIGQVIVHYPKVLLLDEPASGLDPQARINLAKLLTKLRDEKGMTIIVSSHILAELDKYAEELMIIEMGELLDHKVLSERVEKGETTVNLPEIDMALIAKDSSELTNYLISKEYSFVERDGRVIMTGKFSQDDKHNILKDVIKNNIELIEFFEIKKDLQDEYLKVLNSRRDA